MRPRSPAIGVRRVYDPPVADDGLRILIDRLWPRGISKTALKLNAWPKELALSNALRQWYRHDPKKFGAFRRRYLAELKKHGDELSALREILHRRKVTLLTATRKVELSHTTVLAEVLTVER